MEERQPDHPAPEGPRYPCPLESFSVGGFKAFDAGQSIPLKPVTLIFGANSSGKSSILHALILAHHALNSGDLNAHRTAIGGESVDLGGFHQYVHRRNPENEVLLRFHFRPPDTFSFRSALLKPYDDFRIELRLGLDPATRQPRLEGYSAEIGGQELFRMLASPGGEMRVRLWETAHPVSERLFEACHDLTTRRSVDRSDREAFSEGVYGVLENLRVESEALPPFRLSGRQPRGGDENGLPWKILLEKPEDPGDAIRRALGLFFERSLDEILRDLHDLFAESVGHLEYLGPLRKLPRRHLDDDEITSEERASGAFAWKVVMENEAVRDKVNQWLGDPDRLQTPYRLEVRHLVHENTLRFAGPAVIESLYRELVAALTRDPHWDDLQALYDSQGTDLASYVQAHPDLHDRLTESWREAHQDYLRDDQGEEAAEAYSWEEAKGDALDALDLYEDQVRQHFWEHSEEVQAFISQLSNAEADGNVLTRAVIAADPDRRTELSILELRNQTALTHRDIGVGVSQILPVLVQAYASKRKLIAIEQPEIHIHPRLQAELGDVFLESALGPNQNTFILETHSEHLILRILRRIRETTEGDRDEDHPPVQPEDVCVLYVKPDGGAAEVIELPVNSNGDFDAPWPEGFFEERADELFPV